LDPRLDAACSSRVQPEGQGSRRRTVFPARCEGPLRASRPTRGAQPRTSQAGDGVESLIRAFDRGSCGGWAKAKATRAVSHRRSGAVQQAASRSNSDRVASRGCGACVVTRELVCFGAAQPRQRGLQKWYAYVSLLRITQHRQDRTLVLSDLVPGDRDCAVRSVTIDLVVIRGISLVIGIVLLPSVGRNNGTRTSTRFSRSAGVNSQRVARLRCR